jgi:aspartyl-tRNA(Asn)/glutamyl-tRNA(Gln) amidotransferase subunit A
VGDDFSRVPVANLIAGFRSKALSPVEVTTAMLERIERFNPRLNAFTHVDAEGALAAARHSEDRWQRGEPLGALDGIPATVKELLAATDWPLRRCSRATPENAISDFDAPCVARLREQGAVLRRRRCGRVPKDELIDAEAPIEGVFDERQHSYRERERCHRGSGDAAPLAAVNQGNTGSQRGNAEGHVRLHGTQARQHALEQRCVESPSADEDEAAHQRCGTSDGHVEPVKRPYLD